MFSVEFQWEAPARSECALCDSLHVLEHVVSHRMLLAVISGDSVCGEPLGKALRHYGICETVCAVR